MQCKIQQLHTLYLLDCSARSFFARSGSVMVNFSSLKSSVNRDESAIKIFRSAVSAL